MPEKPDKMTAEQAEEAVLNTIDEVSESLTQPEYADMLDGLISNLESRKEAHREEHPDLYD